MNLVQSIKRFRLKRKLVRQVSGERASTNLAMGLPESCAFHSLLYNPLTNMLVAELGPLSSPLRVHRLFARQTDETVYREIGNPEDDISWVHPATSRVNPFLVFVSMQLQVGTDGAVGGNWNALHRVNLKDFTIQDIAKRGELTLPKPYNEGWVSNIVGLWDDGSGIDAVLGLQRPEKGRMDYFLSKLDFAMKTVEPISKLAGVFY